MGKEGGEDADGLGDQERKAAAGQRDPQRALALPGADIGVRCNPTRRIRIGRIVHDQGIALGKAGDGGGRGDAGIDGQLAAGFQILDGLGNPQGCSTLSTDAPLQKGIKALQSRGVSVLTEGTSLVST